MSCDRYVDHDGQWCGDPYCVLIVPQPRRDPHGVFAQYVCDPEDESTSEFVMVERCPQCRSLDTEPFETHVDGTKHCNPCGRIFK